MIQWDKFKKRSSGLSRQNLPTQLLHSQLNGTQVLSIGKYFTGDDGAIHIAAWSGRLRVVPPTIGKDC
ncbi:MAG: hypothetical protein IV107_14380 [Paucibacter sp.]|nr:hypothetical protein [Roseateles sp.]